jgi:hypothetical protein
MKEVIPIPSAEQTVNILADEMFSMKIQQRPTTPAQKVWYNGVIDEMLAAGIIKARAGTRRLDCTSTRYHNGCSASSTRCMAWQK